MQGWHFTSKSCMTVRLHFAQYFLGGCCHFSLKGILFSHQPLHSGVTAVAGLHMRCALRDAWANAENAEA